MLLLIFAVFVLRLDSVGRGLVCVQCTNNTVASCKDHVKNCTAEEFCVSTITQTTDAAGQKTFTFDRDCGDANQCNATGSMTSLISTDISSTCCSTDACTPPQPILSTRKKVKSGVQCPACFAHSPEQCSSSKVGNCTEDEEYCAVYEMKTDTDRTIIMGCASDSFCHTAQGQKLVQGKVTHSMVRCVRGGSEGLTARVVHLLPVLGLIRLL